MLTVEPLKGLPEIAPHAPLASLLAAALSSFTIMSGDVLVVTQKIVSKAEGRFVDLDHVSPGDDAQQLAETTGKDPRLVELVLRESTDVVRAVRGVLITRHRSGHVMANAGIDRSNIGPDGGERVLLLPEDADVSAASIHAELRQFLPQAPGVLISDSFGRPWRHGVTQVAIGAAGFPALIDQRGMLDRDGRQMEVTQLGMGDMIACAAGLVMGECGEGIPAALVRGADFGGAEPNPASAVVRPLNEDLFR